MSKYFDNNLEWNEDTKNKLGTPRPFFNVPSNFYKKNNKFYLHKRVPIPWQSRPVFKENEMLNIIHENEDIVFQQNLCPYCGKAFLPEDIVVRWTASKEIPTKNGPSVASDSHPFHIDCMKQGRVFCPFMREVPESDFEYGPYAELKFNSIEQMKRFGII